MVHAHKLSVALFIIRVSAAAFLGVWASLKFYRPEWMENVFRTYYKIDFVTQDYAIAVGVIQMLIVFMFLIGFQRTLVYGFVMLMHSAGVIGSIPNLLFKFTDYPYNLFWAGVPTLGALIALFILREYDQFTIDGWRKTKNTKR